MTCVVALIEGDKVYMGADSLAVDDSWQRSERADEKMFRIGDWLIGGTTSFRMLDLLRYKFQPPVLDPKEKDLRRYMCTSFVDAIRECLGTGGFRKKENEVEKGGTFLVARQNRLFTIYSDFQVAQDELPYAAVGCAQKVALGSLYSTEEYDAEYRILTALEAAAQFSAGVGQPFRILTT